MTNDTASRGVPFLAARLARLALEVDKVALAITAFELSDADAILLSTASAHLTLASATIGDEIYSVRKIDQRRPGLREAA